MALYQQRLNIVEKENEATKVEELVGGGQVEELIQQATEEAVLANKLIEEYGFDGKVEQPPKDQFEYFEAK